MSEIGDFRCGVVIVAGGSGLRYGVDVPKQFLLLVDKPVLMHTISVFAKLAFIKHIIVVLPSEHRMMWENLCSTYHFDIPHTVTDGGKERFYSVQNGLEHLKNCDLIGIHDGVRPVVSTGLVENCYTTAMLHGSCVPVVPVTDSLRRGDFSHNSMVSRAKLYRVQTPQVFYQKWLFKAYNQPFDAEFTDDASVVENAGYDITLTLGEERNIKITGKPDMELASFYLSI